MNQAQRAALLKLAQTIANNGGDFENDAISATDEDDLMALLSHAEILQRNLRDAVDLVKAVLES